MRIISKDKDYYDVGQGLAFDPEPTYVRQYQKIELNQAGYGKSSFNVGFPAHYSATIGFCGKIYCPLFFDIEQSRPKKICYSLKELDKYIESVYPEEEVKLYYEGNWEDWRSYRRNNPSSGIRQTVLRKTAITRYERFSKSESEPTYFTKYFREYNTPIFVISEARMPRKPCLEINPLLRPWEFFRVFDPYQAYQEISMYVGGVLNGPKNPIPEMDNQTKIDSKGFDEWSFRKPPQNK